MGSLFSFSENIHLLKPKMKCLNSSPLPETKRTLSMVYQFLLLALSYCRDTIKYSLRKETGHLRFPEARSPAGCSCPSHTHALPLLLSNTRVCQWMALSRTASTAGWWWGHSPCRWALQSWGPCSKPPEGETSSSKANSQASEGFWLR